MPRARPVRPVLTGRALVLGAVVVLLVVLLAAPIHRYLGSRGDVGAAAAQLHADRTRLRELRHERALLADPGYVQRQARIRLNFAMPGDTVYSVVRSGQRSEIARTAGTPARPGSTGSWNTRLWLSVRAAGSGKA